MSIVSFPRLIALTAAAPLLMAVPVLAQEDTAAPPQTVESSPEAATDEPLSDDAETMTENEEAAPPLEALPEIGPEPIGPVSSANDLPAPAAPPSRLFADEISYQNDLIIAQGSSENPVRFESGAGKLTALRVQLDILNQTVEASGTVRLERERVVEVRELRPSELPKRGYRETALETLSGENLRFDFKKRTGQFDNAQLQLAVVSISAGALFVNGRRYSAKNVVLRPGSMSAEDRRIYGTPPLNIRARTIEATAGDGTRPPSVAVRGAGLYFKNTKILPIPSYVLRRGLGGGPAPGPYRLTPGISFSSADRILVTTRLATSLSPTPGRLTLGADIGLSQRIGFRGGLGLESQSGAGEFIARARRNDIVETQLTNRILLDRTPEILYNSPTFAAFDLPGGRRAGFAFETAYGRYAERLINAPDAPAVRASRLYGRLLFSTQLRPVDGPFLRLFASAARYGGASTRYNSRGFQVGYAGRLLSRVNGEVSFRSTSLSGRTPFLFDEIEIAREVRTTFDVELSPRYIVPIDLRYDLARRAFRDTTFGILRSYKVFAYGVVYQSARRDLRLEVRQGF